jgi:hypothetical protein
MEMSQSFDSSIPSDIRLLLRADAEQHWLHSEIIPVLHHLETSEELDEEEAGAALAYLEAMWSEADLRARQTDAALVSLHAGDRGGEELSYAAGRYHAAVRVLRGVIAERVTPLVETALGSEVEACENGNAAMRVSDARRPPAGGRTPRAA